MSTLKFIIISGFAGAGKTTIARKIAKEYNLSYFCADDFTEAIKNYQGMTFKEASMLATDIYFHLCLKHLSNGISVLLDTNMHHDYSWAKVDEIQEKVPGIKVIPIVLEAPLEIHKQRVDKRAVEEPQHLNLGGDNFEDITFKYDNIVNRKRNDIIKIGAASSKEEVYKKVTELLD